MINSDWITPAQFANLVPMSKRGAQKVFINALNGKKWRNQNLEVKSVVGRGGKSGINYQLYVNSLQQDLAEKWFEKVRQSTVQNINEPIGEPINGKKVRQSAEKVRQSTVQNIGEPIGEPIKGKKVRQSGIGEQKKTPQSGIGEPIKVHQSTVQNAKTIGELKKGTNDKTNDKTNDISLESVDLKGVKTNDMDRQKSQVVDSTTNQTNDKTNDIFGDTDWLTTEQFFKLVGQWTNLRSAQRVLKDCLSGKKWNGSELKVIEVEGVGRGGKALKVFAKSLPDEYQKKWYRSVYKPPQFVIPTENGGAIDSIDLENNASWYIGQDQKQKDMVAFRYSMIKDLLALPKGTSLMKAIQTKVQQNCYCPNGKNKIGQASFYRWVKDYKEKGLSGLARQGRSDAGEGRIAISRCFDEFAAKVLNEQQCITVQSEIEQYISSMWVDGRFTGTKIITSANMMLQKLVEPMFNRPLTEPEQESCMVSEDWVYQIGSSGYKLVGKRKTDAQWFRDNAIPRLINRFRDGIYPNDVWIGDEHPMDIQCRRRDGSIIHARMIGWLDLATNRLYATLIFMPKGREVRQLDIARSFCNAVKQNGLPKLLYLDNGKPYKWKSMLAGFTTLANLAKQTDFQVELIDSEEFRTVQKFIRERMEREGDNVYRAGKYEPQVKPIEGIFGLLELHYFSLIPGWIGGDRINKKVQVVGKPAKSFPGTFEDFAKEIEGKLALYHATKQGKNGSLKGKSPTGKLHEFIKMGWKARGVEEITLLMAFAEKYDTKGKPLDRKIIAGGILQYAVPDLGTIYYRSDKLMCYADEKLKIMVPRHDPRIIFVKTPEGKIVLAQKVKNYHFLDPNGAEEQRRMAKVLNAQLAVLRWNCSFINNNQITESLLKEAADSEPDDVPFDTSVEISTEETRALEEALENRPLQKEEAEQAASLQDVMWGGDND